MITVEPTHYRLTIAGTPIDVTTEQAQELCASLMSILPGPHDDHDCGCTEPVPGVAAPDFRQATPTLQGVIIPPDPGMPTT